MFLPFPALFGPHPASAASTAGEAGANPYAHLRRELKLGDKAYTYYSLSDLKDPRIGIRRLPAMSTPRGRLGPRPG
jgi:hypothetical protein